MYIIAFNHRAGGEREGGGSPPSRAPARALNVGEWGCSSVGVRRVACAIAGAVSFLSSAMMNPSPAHRPS